MQFVTGSSKDIHEKTREALQGNGALHHDFFKPLSEMDPHQKKKDPIPKFKFAVYNVTNMFSEYGEDDISSGSASDYTRVMNAIASGDFIQLDEKTFHDKDGNIRVFLRWLEYEEVTEKKEETKQEDKEKDKEQDNQPSNKKKSNKPKKQNKKKKKKKPEHPELANDEFFVSPDDEIEYLPSEPDFNI